MIANNELERLRCEAATLIWSAKAELLVGSARRDISRLRLRLAELRLDRRLLAFEAQISARAYNPEQPRVPAGNPTGGRWTIAGGISLAPDSDVAPGDEVQVAGGGHHYVPGELYRNEPLQPETRRVFQDAKTGPLLSGPHRNTDGHPAYNRAVFEEYRRFLSSRGITPEQMTPDQARTFTQQILMSRDPRIFDFNLRLWRRELRLRLFRAPRGE